MQFRLIHLFVLTTLSVSSLWAGPVPITPGQLGVQNISGLTMNGSGVCDSAVGGCGGGFSATVAGKTNVTLWCVDSQEFDKSSYTANIVSLNTPAGTFDDGTQVRYGSVSSATGPGIHWMYDISGIAGISDPNEALTRYRLAAILVSKYQPQEAPTNASNPNNHDIQLAIWQLTENTSIVNGQAGTNGEPTINSGTRETAWITTAAGLLGSFNFNGWAVASGEYDAVNHTLLGSPVQTYLVEVTPEPRFYGILLIGLLSLFGIVYRRRVAS
jgi:hypothetical protein